ncbi:Adaptor protein complex AP-2 alpha subunit [Pelomyxa schiedti]|nr:Adaptor protein complex AP-2 alpha subunit [Pelomyxa schiedti]
MAASAGIAKDFMRGLHNFISAIHNAPSKEIEKKRIDKEMAKIRKEFREAKSLDGYARRKYVSKLLYMYMLGYELDFGHMEAVTLLSSTKFHEKQMGYLAMSLLLNENHEMLPLIINSLSEDLQARGEFSTSLALVTIASIGGKEMTESLAPAILNLLLSTTTPGTVRKKAAMCFLRLYRKDTNILQVDSNIHQKLLALLDDHDLGVVNSVVSLLSAIAQTDTTSFEAATPKILRILNKTVLKEYSREYIYHDVPHPWLQVKCLRFLKLVPPSQKVHLDQLTSLLTKIFSQAEPGRGSSENQKNALNAVLFEAIAVVIHLEYDQNLLSSVTTFLGRFISAREINVRYLGLEAMALMSQSDSAHLIKKHQKTVTASLQESDISIRRRSLDLLYAMCDRDSSKEILVELLNYLSTCDIQIKEELVLKIAILAEKFSQTYAWYVDVILQLIRIAGDYVSDDIWFRVVKIVTNNEDIQEYATKTVFKALKAEPWHETMVKVGGYLLGEFGHLIAEQPGSSTFEQFKLLHTRYNVVSLPTRALLLSTYAKFVNLFPEVRNPIREVFTQHQDHIDAEVQQRACEYLRLTNPGAEELLQVVLEIIPPWEDKKPGASSSSSTVSVTPTTPATSSVTSTTPEPPRAPPKSAPITSPPTTSTAAKSTASGVLDLLGFSSVQAQTNTNLSVTGSSSSGALSLLDGPVTTVTAQPQISAVVSTPAVDTTFSSGPGLLGLGGTQASGGLNVDPGLGLGLGGLGMGVTANTGGLEIGGASMGAPAQDAMTSGLGVVQPLGTGISGDQLQHTQMFWRRLCVAAEGVLYQDSTLQIGVKSEYQQAEGRVVLFFGNSTTMPLNQFTVTLQKVTYLTIKPGALANVIPSKAQIQYPLEITCLREFPDTPTMQVSYSTIGRTASFVIPLPIFLSKFMYAKPTPAPEFLQTWKNLVGPGLEVQEVFPSKTPIDLQWVSKLFSQGFKIAVLENIDNSRSNLVLGATLHLSDGEVPVLMRLETNSEAKMYRLTIRSQHAAACDCLKPLIVTQLAGSL